MKPYHCRHHDTPSVKSVGIKFRRNVKCLEATKLRLVQDVKSQEMRNLTILLRSLTFNE